MTDLVVKSAVKDALGDRNARISTMPSTRK